MPSPGGTPPPRAGADPLGEAERRRGKTRRRAHRSQVALGFGPRGAIVTAALPLAVHRSRAVPFTTRSLELVRIAGDRCLKLHPLAFGPKHPQGFLILLTIELLGRAE